MTNGIEVTSIRRNATLRELRDALTSLIDDNDVGGDPSHANDRPVYLSVYRGRRKASHYYPVERGFGQFVIPIDGKMTAIVALWTDESKVIKDRF